MHNGHQTLQGGGREQHVSGENVGWVGGQYTALYRMYTCVHSHTQTVKLFQTNHPACVYIFATRNRSKGQLSGTTL